LKWLNPAYRRVTVKSLSLPGDIAQRMREPRVVALAESTDELGGEAMHAPTIDGDTNRLIAGRDRMAATLLRKRKHVWVHVGIDWTPEELLKAEIHENLHRRHDDKAALTRRLVDKATELLDDARRNTGSDVPVLRNESGPGQPKTTRQEARELVAAAAGETVATIKKRDQRAQARDEAAGQPAATLTGPPPPIETYGHAPPASVAGAAAPVVELLRKIDQLLRQAQSAAGLLSETPCDPAVAQRVRSVLHDVAAQVRAEMPTHLCPYCYGELGRDCKACGGRGYVTRQAFESAPVERRGLTWDDVPAIDVDVRAAQLGAPFPDVATLPRVKAKRSIKLDGVPLDDIAVVTAGVTPVPS
jgi:hypothetical protein